MDIQNNYLERFLEQNSTLAKTIVIKFNEAALLVNEGVIEKHGTSAVDTLDPASWKYYLNLAGRYHFSDTVMTVTSIDTLEAIEFTVENLRLHPATASAYKYGTRLYESLVYQYPEQETLINSILTPCDIETAIAAENGTILAHPKALVEEQEMTLIQDLESYIKNIFSRWFNGQFIMSDNLYATVFMAKLYESLYPKLLNLRHARCKTIEAHSFHIQMYLASHSRMDRYIPYLTLKQVLWLYRNILYLERHPGQVQQFLKLIEKILQERNIPIGEYSIRQLDEFSDGFPAITARLKTLSVNNESGISLVDLGKLHEKELELDQGNTAYYTASQERDDLALRTANGSVIQTKMLESSMVDLTNAIPEPIEDVALREWCSLALSGLYTAVVTFKDPKTSEYRTISARDAFLYLQYLGSASAGVIWETFPDYINSEQRKHVKPKVSDLLELTPYKEIDLSKVAEALLLGQPNLQHIYSIDAFYKYVSNIHSQAYWHWFLISSFHTPYERGLVDNMCHALYEDCKYNLLSQNITVKDWLSSCNLPEFDLDEKEAGALLKAVFEAATGIYVDETKLLRNIQKQLVNLVTELSSYTVRIMTNINEADITVVNFPCNRVNPESVRMSIKRRIPVDTDIVDASGGQSAFVVVDDELKLLVEPEQPTNLTKQVFSIDPEPVVTKIDRHQASFSLQNIQGVIDITYSGQDESLEEESQIPGLTTWSVLPDALKLTVKSKYQ